MSNTLAVKLADVSKRYSDVIAVDHLNLEVEKGEIIGLLGLNGSGKSTTLKMILGLVKADSGSINVLGINVSDDPMAVKKQLGYFPEAPRVYEFLTGLEFLDFAGDIYGMKLEEKKKRIDEFLKALSLEGREGDMISAYSEGMKQKVIIISAIMHKPEPLIMDEPITSLDPKAARIVKDLLRRRARLVFVFVTHLSQKLFQGKIRVCTCFQSNCNFDLLSRSGLVFVPPLDMALLGFSEAIFLVSALTMVSLSFGIRGADFQELFPRSRMIRPKWSILNFIVCVLVGLSIVAPAIPILLNLFASSFAPSSVSFTPFPDYFLYIGLVLSGVIAVVMFYVFRKIALDYAKRLLADAERL